MSTNELTIGGISSRALVEKYGSPLYVYDSEIITRQFKRLTDSFSKCKTKFYYACKANSNPYIIKFIHGLGACIDAVSANEVELAIKCGVPVKDILYTPNCVAFSEIEEIVNKDVIVNIDNLSVLEHFGQTFGNSEPCAIRINPHILAGGNSHIQTGHIDSKFGISIHQLRHILRIVNAYNIKVTGLHMHTGSDIVDARTFTEGADILFSLAINFKELDFIDFGSGFKVPYKADDLSTDIENIGEEICGKFNDFCIEYEKELELRFEPGKYLVSESGFLLVTVTVVKQTPSCVFLGTDSGLHHLIRPMLYDSYHSIINADKLDGVQRVYSVVGCICETDTFGTDRKITETNEGDILAIKNAGAYCFSMSSNYNMRSKPAEVFILHGEDILIRKRESIDDILLGCVNY